MDFHRAVFNIIIFFNHIILVCFMVVKSNQEYVYFLRIIILVKFNLMYFNDDLGILVL